ncbi:hypothetical protein AB9K34_08360 [Sedimentitalea sp. XS_ASV28]|uniref:hypothetical protein n=1 Tax=Sedimentitalea sp. XS_ASV28 TaxID=3241296 RepID=UPI003518BC7A
MDIFSKRDGPRPEDARAKRLISENAGTIRRLADQITNGGFTKMRQDQARRKEKPKPEGLLIYTMSGSGAAKSDDPDPYVRLSLNGRIVLADRNNGRQLQLLGEIRTKLGVRRVVLATKENGFISPLGDEIRESLIEYDDIGLNADFTEEDLVLRLEESLGLSSEILDRSDSQTDKRDGTPDDDSSELL